jgi:hypothetical protein
VQVLVNAVSHRHINSKEHRGQLSNIRMISATQCRDHAKECDRLGRERDISIQRATVLMGMAHSWDLLSDYTGRYEAIVKAETK